MGPCIGVSKGMCLGIFSIPDKIQFSIIQALFCKFRSLGCFSRLRVKSGFKGSRPSVKESRDEPLAFPGRDPP